ncbi:MAG: class I tRNA ligase family protein, partial [Thermoplasmata archaeon]
MEADRTLHWQEEWRRAGLATARRDPSRGKFYAVVAYPGPSGFLHVGHLRGIVYADAFHRFHRMLGEQVFFPSGVHASGLPAVTFAQRVRDRHPNTIQELEQNGVPPSEWPKLEDPEFAARFLGAHYLEVFRQVGVLIDESAYLTTVDDDYRAFIRWQFNRLRDRDALLQKTHYSAFCPVCGPVAVDPSETDLSAGGSAEIIRYTTVPFRLQDGRILLAATLRPETIYGVTNLWIPTSEPLVSWTSGGPTYLVSRTGAERLVEQHGGRIGHEIRPAELRGRTVTVPLTDVPVPIFPSSLVDPKVGTGIVMSVPAHAPADALALAELTAEQREGLRPSPVILAVPPAGELPASERALAAGSGSPAERANRATGAAKLADSAAIQEATERLYRLESARGTMTVRDYLGVPVREARERVTGALVATKQSFELQEFSEPVICRNGHAVVIRRVPHQWFIRYSDPEWKTLGQAAIRSMVISPDDYARDLPGILDWMDDRPCTRRGRWLGTPLPFDPEWMIEPIADSTFYPAYYIVRRFVRERGILPSSLTDAFFDFVFLGEGAGEPTVDPAVQEEIRTDFLYWYPLDCNIGGKEHKRVHFPPFILTHAKLLPPELGPRGIFVHGWVTSSSGEKISKKDVSAKGGRILPIRDALARWGPDALRLVYAISALPSFDLEWDPELADAAAGRLEDVARIVREAAGAGAGVPEL